MPIFKPHVEGDYTVIHNKTLRDKSLSFEARGVLALMLSMPTNWEMYKSWLVDQCKMTGKDKMTRILKELETAKYLVRVKKRDSTGKFDSYIWHVYPEPTENGSSGDGSAGDGKSAPTKEIDIQKKENTNVSQSNELAHKIIDLWNDVKKVNGTNWQSVDIRTKKRISLTNQRIKQVRQRIDEPTDKKVWNWFSDFFCAMAKDPWYSGKQNNYKLEFGQMMAEDYFVKTIERLNGE